MKTKGLSWLVSVMANRHVIGRVRLTLLALFCAVTLVVQVSAQHFKQLFGNTLTQVAAGRNEVFGIGTSNQVYRYNPGTKLFVQIPGSFTQVAVGGGTLSQKDEIWGIGTSGQIYHFNFGTKTFTQVTGSLAQVVVGEGVSDRCHPYEVWGLNGADNIYRYNYCTKVFEQIAGSLSHVATGGGSVWGLNSSAQIYFYDLINGGFVQVAGSLQQIAVSGNDVWGLDGSGNVYRYDPNGGVFVQYNVAPCFPRQQVATGGDGVWLSDPPNVCNYTDSGEFIYGSFDFSQVAVGYGTGVWGVGFNSSVWTFVRP